MSRLVGMHHGASDSATLGVGMGGEGGGALAPKAPLGANHVGSPRQECALAAAAAGPREPFPIAQRQPSPFGDWATRCVARLALSDSLISAFNPGLRRLRTLLPGATHQGRR